jgi:diguanylate cyclase (GGDEF)-like protein
MANGERERIDAGTPRGRGGAPDAAHRGEGRSGDADARGRRRRASHSLWAACEALLSSEPRAMARALDALALAFDCEGVAIHALSPGGTLDPLCARGEWRLRPGDLRACLSVPLVRGDEPIGNLDLVAGPGARWSALQLGLVRTAAGALGAALGARLELQRLRQAPGRDPVTGLPDAAMFKGRLGEELARALRQAGPVGLVMIDLDHFGALDAKYGRAAGDRVLAEAALVLRLTLRESDVVGRMGGDQFAVLLPDTDLVPARRVAERLVRALESHRFERVGTITSSAGVVCAPRHGGDTLTLLDAADRALGLAKKAGRRRVRSGEAVAPQ